MGLSKKSVKVRWWEGLGGPGLGGASRRILCVMLMSRHCQEIQPVYPKGNWSWIFIGRTNAEAEMPIFWPPDMKNWPLEIPWSWERLKAGGERDDKGWNDWMASPTQWTWVWASFGSWWGTEKPGMLQSPCGHKESDTTEQLIWTKLNIKKSWNCVQWKVRQKWCL